MTTRAKGKQTMLTEAERQEQYNKLREEELRCKAMQEKLRAQRLQLEKLQAPPPPPPQKEMIGVNPRQQEPPRFRPKLVPVEEISDNSESDAEEHYRRRHQRISPLSEELEEVQWPHRLNPAILPQFDGESDPEEFLLKYEATIETSGGGTACKAKALVLALKGLVQRWYANIPPGTILSWKQLRLELCASFRAMRPDEVTSCDFHDLRQGSMTLQEYL